MTEAELFRAYREADLQVRCGWPMCPNSTYHPAIFCGDCADRIWRTNRDRPA